MLQRGEQRQKYNSDKRIARLYDDPGLLNSGTGNRRCHDRDGVHRGSADAALILRVGKGQLHPPHDSAPSWHFDSSLAISKASDESV